jgi:hypothetical protein
MIIVIAAFGLVCALAGAAFLILFAHSACSPMEPELLVIDEPLPDAFDDEHELRVVGDLA